LVIAIRYFSCVAAALIALALCSTGCGSSGGNKTTSAATTQPSPAPSSTPARIEGKYVAHLTTDGLSAAGVDYLNVGGGGIWHLTVTGHRVSLKPPPPAQDETQYPIVSVKAGRLTLGPEKACSTTEGKTQNSIFTFSQSAAGLKFVAVKTACKEDGGSLAVAPWRRQP
jgi:hypothetical protein